MRARSSSRICPAVAIGLTLAALAGCGDPAKLLPPDDASAMDGALQRVADATIADSDDLVEFFLGVQL